MAMTNHDGLPTAIYTAAGVRELDRIAIEQRGLGGALLMARAAQAAYTVLRRRWPRARRLAVACGRGNNGGDGLILARLAHLDALDVEVLLMRPARDYQGAAREALESARAAGVPISAYAADRLAADVIVDAILGTGLDRPLTEDVGAVVEQIRLRRERGTGVLAIDIPTGLSADTGAILGRAVRADVTTTFIGLKLGLFTGEGPACSGHVSFHDLEVPDAVYGDVAPVARATVDADVKELLPARSKTAHKRHNGHVVAVGGGEGTGGAIRLSAEAALRSGAGLVSVATRAANAAAMTQARPELMCQAVADGDQLKTAIARATALVVGPGLGQDGWGQDLWQAALTLDQPMVVDADALNLLAGQPRRRDNWVLTPHPGEAARLLGADSSEIQRDRVAAVRELVKRYGGVVVLKGAGTLIATAQPDTLHLCRAGNPGMAVGGMGDLLSGVIAALLAQGLALPDAARLGVHCHARAGDLAAAQGGERGLLPSDLLPWLRHMVNSGADDTSCG